MPQYSEKFFNIQPSEQEKKQKNPHVYSKDCLDFEKQKVKNNFAEDFEKINEKLKQKQQNFKNVFESTDFSKNPYDPSKDILQDDEAHKNFKYFVENYETKLKPELIKEVHENFIISNEIDMNEGIMEEEDLGQQLYEWYMGQVPIMEKELQQCREAISYSEEQVMEDMKKDIQEINLELQNEINNTNILDNFFKDDFVESLEKMEITDL